MLQHQPEEPTASNAADARVTPEELNAALKALEDKQSNTVAIGSVVDELRLNATPEQIWTQVQQQRHQGQAAQIPPAQSFAVMPETLPRRRVWWAMITAISFLCGGIVMLNSSTDTSGGVKISGQTLTMSGDRVTGPFQVQGKDVVISGNDDLIILHGKARSVTVTGSDNKLRGDEPKTFSLTGDDNDVEWTGTK